MYFLLKRCFKGVVHTLGIVTGETPEATAKKLGVEIEGHMSKWDGLGAYYLKTDEKGPKYILEHWAELSTFPPQEIQEHNLTFPKPISG